MTTEQTTISDLVTHDHRELEEYYGKITDPGSDHDTKTRYQNQFIWELARHSIAEEIVLYPAMEKYVPGGKEMADKDRDEHNQVKKQLYEFQKLNSDDTRFQPCIKELWQGLAKHIKEEEEQDLVLLEKYVEQDKVHEMGKSFQRTKHFVPTRSHPSAPDKPPFETAVGLLTAPIDKLMDAFKRFPKD